MAEKHLDRPEISAGFEQMGGKAVSQSVNSNVLAQAGVLRGPNADFVYSFTRDVCARDIPWEKPVSRSNDPPVFTEQGEQPRREHDVMVPTSFGLPDADDHALAINVIDSQSDHFGKP
jgi:hypothetical protein